MNSQTKQGQSIYLHNKSDNYKLENIREFIQFLGLWRCPAPYRMLDSRSDQEYAHILRKLIQANKTRKDEIGKMETAEAQRQLVYLKMKNPVIT